MLSIFASIAPVFALIILGYALRKKLISNMDFWQLCDTLVYWVMMPALLFYHTSTINLSSNILGNYAVAILSAFFIAVIASLFFSWILKFNGKVTSSVLQGSCRHNSFIVLAIAGKLFGTEGLALATLAMAILIPMTNITVVTLMTGLLQTSSSQNFSKTIIAILKSLAKNPILISILIGLLFSLYGGGKIFILHDTVHLLGSGALPIILLVIGANIRPKQISGEVLPVLVSSSIKLFLFPAVLFLVAQTLGLNQTQTIVLVLFGAVPTAVSSYTLANQMGGDAKLMNTIITLQTLFSFVSIPLLISFLQP